MRQKTVPSLLFLTLLVILSACQGQADTPPAATSPPVSETAQATESPQDDFIGMPNPASFYCQELGYQLEMRETEEGTQGVCVFFDGSECEEWEFLAGRCGQEKSFCELQGYELREAGEIANCVFEDSSTCPEYLYFIGECLPPE
jgi:hypothetical protein